MYCQSVTVCQDVSSGVKSNTCLYRQRKSSYRKQVTCNIPPEILSFLQQSHLHQFPCSSARLNDLFVFILQLDNIVLVCFMFNSRLFFSGMTCILRIDWVSFTWAFSTTWLYLWQCLETVAYPPRSTSKAQNF